MNEKKQTKRMSPGLEWASMYWILLILLPLYLSGCSSGAVSPPEITETWKPPEGAEAIAPYSCDEIKSLFAYDAEAPLDIQETGRRREDGVTIIDLSYASPMGGRVPATLVLPDGPGPFAGMLYQHGMPSTRQPLVPGAVTYARMGTAVLLIDAPFARRANGLDEPITYTEQDRGEQIQLIIDLRRGIDLLLARPEIDPQRLAYTGISYGGAMGGLLAGVEERLKGYVLQVGDGGLVTHVTGTEDTGMWQSIPQDTRQQWLAWMWPVEPIHYVGCAAPAALLFQNGTQDKMVPPADALRYQQAGSQPKTVLWYENGHELGTDAARDQADWLSRAIGIATRRLFPYSLQLALTAWSILTAASLALMAWELWGVRPTPGGARLRWMLATVFLGPLVLAGYWTSVRRPLSSSVPAWLGPPTRLAAGSAAWAASATVLGGIGVLALLQYLPQVFGAYLPMQIAATFVVPFSVVWIISAVSSWVSRKEEAYARAYREPVFTQVISTCLVLAGVYPVVNILIGRWFSRWTFPFGLDLSYPPLWGALCLGTFAGALAAYPFHLWMLRRGIIRWRASGAGEPAASRPAAWYVQAGLALVSFAAMLAAIFLSIRIASG